ncbi:flagellar basal body-associated FliL family protein [Aestuariivirga sp. YIM B02566]|uniref:Flagellar basal body-associated FliL family protein n=1 Tax=Taklimakanibacter albus TaxID=2800327 RepID=A0ACC5RAC9_9HYPH|nr:flagellar basal body-associated FliL family protein [Aestuariivirga sp. YIM B02566]MBK1869641.1 flagellar basal body-associated FliL family protein [Aestuariivirga sp. YIM B02566]
MAEETEKTEGTDAVADTPKPGTSIISLIVALVLVTALAAGAGGLVGILLYSKIEHVAKEKAAAKEEKAVAEYAGDLTVTTVPPILTNLANPSTVLLRIEASLIFDGAAPKDADALATQISGDAMAYLRTVSLRQIEGASGLLHLREDLTERAKIRSEGRVREFIIQGLAVE